MRAPSPRLPWRFGCVVDGRIGEADVGGVVGRLAEADVGGVGIRSMGMPDYTFPVYDQPDARCASLRRSERSSADTTTIDCVYGFT